ncbi:aminoacyl-tRNA hydrolase [Candidatus Dojkabacteria bacterium]|nr:aminoacyl-tRNA hydrolase [Candidatus Dojkabacteria bacterium]
MIIVGLGNPGERYRETRHNSGFMFVEGLRDYIERNGGSVTEWEREDVFNADIAKCEYNGNEMILIKPQSFMNNSGEVVAKYIAKKGIKNLNEELVLVHDDLDIQLGKYKIQFGMSPKGHNGVNDVEEKLGRVDFKRIRIGVDDRIDRVIPPDAYVLQRLDSETLSKLSEVLESIIVEYTLQFQK